MKISGLNEGLSLLSNVGVLLGLIFLIVELNQSNRIAQYSAESVRSSQFIDINSSRIEHADTYAKLMKENPQLTDEEYAQSLFMARQLTNTWGDAEDAYNLGLLSEVTFDQVLTDIKVSMSETPGLKPTFEYLIDAYGATVDDGPVMRTLIEELGFSEP